MRDSPYVNSETYLAINVPLRFGCEYGVEARPAKSVEKLDPEGAAGLIGKLSTQLAG